MFIAKKWGKKIGITVHLNTQHCPKNRVPKSQLHTHKKTDQVVQAERFEILQVHIDERWRQHGLELRSFDRCKHLQQDSMSAFMCVGGSQTGRMPNYLHHPDPEIAFWNRIRIRSHIWDQGCGSSPFSAGSGSGSSKSEFLKPNPNPTGTYQESIQKSKFFSHQIYFFWYLNDYFLKKKWNNSPENV